MTHPTATCDRCGITRTANPKRGHVTLCRDCQFTEPTWPNVNDTDTCPSGHHYTDENTYREPRSGHRACRTCRREYTRRKAIA